MASPLSFAILRPFARFEPLLEGQPTEIHHHTDREGSHTIYEYICE